MAKLKPITRKEKYLAKAGGQSVTVPLRPITREEQFLKDIIDAIESGGSSSDYAVDIDFSMNSQTFVVTAQLKNKDGDLIGTAKSVDIPLESTVVNGSYNNATKTLTLTLVSGQSINIPIGDIISGLQAEITAQNPLNADFVDDTNSTHKFVTAAEKKQISDNADAIGNAESKIYDILDELDTKLPDKGNYTEFANGQRLYVSTTQPTGDIAEGSVGIGW
jgi:hypothetical protein